MKNIALLMLGLAFLLVGNPALAGEAGDAGDRADIRREVREHNREVRETREREVREIREREIRDHRMRTATTPEAAQRRPQSLGLIIKALKALKPAEIKTPLEEDPEAMGHEAAVEHAKKAAAAFRARERAKEAEREAARQAELNRSRVREAQRSHFDRVGRY